MDYRQSGVNVEEGYRAVGKYKESAGRTVVPGVLNGLGSFAGMFSVPSGYVNPVLVSGTDGVGTKLEVAFAMQKYGTVGIDCVAMCVNDILCHGAKPLFFLDYLACGKLSAEVAAELVSGVAEGCVQSGAALLGGETAEMPGFYGEGKYDIAGFAVGIAEKERLIDGSSITAGDVLIGLASSGIHSNGFSLVRRLIRPEEYTAPFGPSLLGDVLLEPTRIYVKPVLEWLEKFPVHGMAHITGGGFFENIPRMFKAGSLLAAQIDSGSWPVPGIFGELVKRGADADRMYHTFNMGVGFVLAVPETCASDALAFFNGAGFPAYRIGSVAERTENQPPLFFAD